MIAHFIGAAIQLVLYMCILAGSLYLSRNIWMTTYKLLRTRIAGAAQRRKLKTENVVRAGWGHFKSGDKAVQFERHLIELIESATKWDDYSGLHRFYTYCAGVAIAVYAFVYFGTGSPIMPLAPAVLSLGAPYAFLRVRRHWRTIRNSYEIEPVVMKLLPKYRALKYNMPFALMEAINDLPESPIRNALSRLSVKLSNYTTRSEVDRAIASFDYQVGTSWGQQLSNIICLSVVDGIVTEALLVDLITDIEKVNRALKQQRVDRVDTLFLGFIPLVGLPASIFFLQTKMSHKILLFQFHTQNGIKGFLIALLLSLFSFAVAAIFYKPKQDI